MAHWTKRDYAKLTGPEVNDLPWDDLRVAVSATTVNGSNPPLEALFVNDGNEVPGTAYALSFLSTSLGNLTLPDDALFDTSNDFTFEFWVRPTVSTQQVECMRKQGVFEIDFRNANIFRYNVTGDGNTNGVVQFNRGSWNHMLVVHDDSEDEISFYLNNILDITVSIASVVDNTNDFVFNRSETLYDVDYIAYWDKALSVSEISDRYAAGAGDQLVGNEVGLKGLWEMNDGSGTTAVEKTGLPTASDGSITGGTENTHWAWIGGHVGNVSSGSRGVILKYFPPDVESELYFEAQLPHAWKEGDTLHCHVHAIPNTDGGVGEKIKWGFEYAWSSIGEVFGNTTIIYTTENHLEEDLVKNKHYIFEFPFIDGKHQKISSMLSCRIFRAAADAEDTYTDFAGLLEFDFHYRSSSSGSYHEFQKLGESYAQQRGTPSEPFKPGAY